MFPTNFDDMFREELRLEGRYAGDCAVCGFPVAFAQGSGGVLTNVSTCWNCEDGWRGRAVICIEARCAATRVPGEVYCAEHLTDEGYQPCRTPGCMDMVDRNGIAVGSLYSPNAPGTEEHRANDAAAHGLCTMCRGVLEGQEKERRRPPPRTPLHAQAQKGGECSICGDVVRRLQVDHIHPRSQGGGDDPANLRLLCPPCNMSKGGRTDAEWVEALQRRIARRRAENATDELRLGHLVQE